MPGPDLPGISRGKLNTYWIGPYVKASDITVGKRDDATVIWFAEDGRIKRQISVKRNSIQQGFIYSTSPRVPEAVARNRYSPGILRRMEYQKITER